MSEKVVEGGTLKRWRDAFVELNRCEWPGPKPIEEASDQLRGRRREIGDLATACLTNDLLIIRGESGVGKSSLLGSGLIPELKRQHNKVLYCNAWDGDAKSWQEAAQHVVEHARFTGPDNPFGGEATELSSRFPDQLVIVLDQFEEAIRNSKWLAHHALKWVEETAGATSARFVISLRSEHEHELSGLLTKPFAKRERREIRPITDLRAIRLIIEGNPVNPAEAMPIDAAATDRLLEAWVASQALDATTAWDRPGLLHLQAALYVLWMSRPAGAPGITVGDVDGLLREFANQRSVSEAEALTDLLGFALEKSVDISVEKCMQACEEVDVPNVTVNQAKWMFRDITGHLSSGGYKTPQHMWDLAVNVIGLGAAAICTTVRDIVEPVYRNDDWLGVQRADYLEDLLALPAQGRQLGSGAAAGLLDAEVMFELYRCYFFALEWLTTSNVARLERATSGRVVSLTHDRYEEGLKRWRDRERESFKESVEQLTSVRGEDKSWQDVSQYNEFRTPKRPDANDLVGIEGDQRLIVNVNWRSCKISATEFSDIAFVNCDFQGSTFYDCSFNGATFVNCVLDQVDFISCTIKGAAQYPPNQLLDQIKPGATMLSTPPTFSMDVPLALARSLGALRPTCDLPVGSSRAHLDVQESGIPAMPRLGPAEKRDVRAFAALPIRSGGLSMCGGRLSALTFRRCVFGGDSDIVSFRHVAGSSLEICEQSSGTFHLFGAGIRALAITRPVADLEPVQAPVSDPLILHATQVRIVNAWFGARLSGRAKFTNSKIWNAINASEGGFTFEIDDCEFFGLVNTGRPTSSNANPDFTIDALGASAQEVLEFSKNVDFRESVATSPAVGESDG